MPLLTKVAALMKEQLRLAMAKNLDVKVGYSTLDVQEKTTDSGIASHSHRWIRGVPVPRMVSA